MHEPDVISGQQLFPDVSLCHCRVDTEAGLMAETLLNSILPLTTPEPLAGPLQTQNVPKLQKYYEDAYPIFRNHCKDQFFVYSGEVYYEIPGTQRQQWFANSSYTKVLQDIHECGPMMPAPALGCMTAGLHRISPCLLLSIHAVSTLS